MGRCREAIREYEMALASNRNWASAIGHIGRCKIYIGPIEEALPLEEQAIRLSPRYSDIGLWYFRIGQVHLLQSRIDEATAWLEKARSASPTLALTSADALKGETERGARLQPGAASGFHGKRDHLTRSNRDHGHHWLWRPSSIPCRTRRCGRACAAGPAIRTWPDHCGRRR